MADSEIEALLRLKETSELARRLPVHSTASPGEIPLQEQASPWPKTGSSAHWSPIAEPPKRSEYALQPGALLCTLLFIAGCLLPPLLWLIGPILSTSSTVHPDVRARFFYATVVSLAFAGLLSLAALVTSIILYKQTGSLE